MWDRDKIKALVISEIEKYAPRIDGPVTEDMGLIIDLKLLGDDATALALVLQRKVGTKPPLDQWSEVETVEDMIDLLLMHGT